MDVITFSIRNFDLKVPFQETVLIRNLSIDFVLNQVILYPLRSSKPEIKNIICIRMFS